ncbi:MAG: hypothetical protein AAFP84_14175 [Actinomycetota bacterium]
MPQQRAATKDHACAATEGGEQLYWWRMPVRRDRAQAAGERMLLSVGVWLASVVGIAIVIGVLVS